MTAKLAPIAKIIRSELGVILVTVGDPTLHFKTILLREFCSHLNVVSRLRRIASGNYP